MVKVYLPLGYPAMQGEVEQMLIYQGDVVRVYQVPTDPRTEAQLFERKFLADLVKMRSNLGTWARGACRAVFGSKWGTVVYQFVKLDHATCWSAAVATWDEFSTSQKEVWWEFAPYQATYNDPGKIFYALSVALYSLLVEYSGNDWGAASWTGGQAETCLDWWLKDMTDILTKEKTDDEDERITYSGGINSGAQEGCYDGTIHGAYPASGTSFAFYCLGRTVDLVHKQESMGGNFPVYVDGRQIGVLHENKAGIGENLQVSEVFDMGYRGLHYVKVVGSGNYAINLDAIEVD